MSSISGDELWWPLLEVISHGSVSLMGTDVRQAQERGKGLGERRRSEEVPE